jgi:predicted RNase H-like HicB family nuclease
MQLRYTVIFEKDEDGWFVASAPALGCAAQGRSRPAALRALRTAIDSYIQARRAHRWAILREDEGTVSRLEIVV